MSPPSLAIALATASFAFIGISTYFGRATADTVRCFQSNLDHSNTFSHQTLATYYVYILKCNDGSPYTGCTKDLKERFQRHINGDVPATKLRLPVEVIFYSAFKDKYKAFDFEK